MRSGVRGSGEPRRGVDRLATCVSVLLGCVVVLGAGALVFAGCAAGPPLGLATSGPTTLDPAQVRQATGNRPEAARELYDRWGTRWCFGAGAPVAGAPAVGREGQIYVATHEGYLHALDRLGAFQWSYTVKGAIHVPPVVLPNGTVVVATKYNLLYAIRPNGTRLWVYRVPDPIQTPLVVSKKGTLIFGGGRFYAYAVSSHGGLVWRIKLPATVTEAVRLHKDGTVFIGTHEGVATWQVPARRQLWKSSPVESFLLGDPPVGTDPIWLASGRAFSSDGPVDLGDGLRFGRFLEDGGKLVGTRSELRWMSPTGKPLRTVQLPIEPSAAALLEPNGEVWVPTIDGTLLGVAPQADAALPVARIGFGPVSTVVAEGDDQIVAASGEGNVCSVSRTRLDTPP